MEAWVRSAAEILPEYGAFPGVDHVHGVTFDGQHVWFASGDKLASSGTALGKAARAICGESIRERERSWRGSRCIGHKIAPFILHTLKL
jgi:hypothetical protein